MTTEMTGEEDDATDVSQAGDVESAGAHSPMGIPTQAAAPDPGAEDTMFRACVYRE